MTASVREQQSIGGGEGGFVLTAAVIADVVGGRLVGDPTVIVRGVAPLDRATASDLSFFAIPKYAIQFETTGAGVVLVSPQLAELPGSPSARVVVDRPHEALLSLVPKLYRHHRASLAYTGASPSGTEPSLAPGSRSARTS